MTQRCRVDLILAMLALLFASTACWPPGPPTPVPTPTPEPLIPTIPASTPSATTQEPPAATSVPPTRNPARPAPSGTPQPFVFNGSERSRVCVSVPGTQATVYDFDWGDGVPGWWLNWTVLPVPPPGPPFAQMVRLRGATILSDIATIGNAARAAPGSLWLIGNEMDVEWQDNVTPEQYARSYARLYRAIKAADPAALVAIGGVSQPTPMRLAYLDRILAAYRQAQGEDMPVDVWNVHAFVLREERNSWGVGIPPGTKEDSGVLREIQDHTDMTIFRQQIVGFRRWLAEHGFRDRPLIVSEYGVLMPEDYGFPPDVVIRFMTDTFDFFLEARDGDIGFARDDNRLVQRFCWFSAADQVYATGNLFDPVTRQRTVAGEAFRAYVEGLRD